MPFPRPDEATKAYFESVLPDDPRVQVRPMFGNVAGFLNGNMFIGVFGNDLLLRLSEEDRAQLLQEEGAAIFEPMEGRPMKEYVQIPRTWRDEPDRVRGWVARSVEWVGDMPEKKPKKKSSRRG